MASELRFRPIFAYAASVIAGLAVFVYSLPGRCMSYVASAIFSVEYRPDAHTRLHIDSMERELRASTLKLTALGERFKAFIQRRREHAYFSDGGFIPDIGHPAV